MGDVRRLRVVAEAEDLILEVYRSTQNFPAEERYGLRAQLRSAAVSVGLNLAEGCGRMGDGDFRRSLSIARGSVGELELGLRVASRLGITDEAALEKVRPLVRRVGGMITMLIRRMG